MVGVAFLNRKDRPSLSGRSGDGSIFHPAPLDRGHRNEKQSDEVL
jgi:hypothetical protein